MNATSAAMFAILSMTAQAAEPTGTLMLACEGTVARGKPSPGNTYPEFGKPEPMSTSILLNFTTRKAEIADFISGGPINIMFSSETHIFFGTYDEKGNPNGGFAAKINRVTGEMDASDTVIDGNGLYSTTRYTLKCKPTQRMF
jgi:hypothetical protein